MTGSTWDVIALVLFSGGALAFVVTAIGLVRIRTLLDRNHVASLPQMLALDLMLIGAGFALRSPGAWGMLALIGVVQVITAPIANHFLARSAFRTGMVPASDLAVDELSALVTDADDVDDHVDYVPDHDDEHLEPGPESAQNQAGLDPNPAESAGDQTAEPARS